jgi:hypothetical protein
MFVDKFLLPRFLVLELVLASHFFQFTKACKKIEDFAFGDFGFGSDSGSKDACLIPLDSAGWSHQPLLYSETKDWIYPETGRIVRVGPGEKILLSCPGSSLHYSSTPSLLVSCTGSKLQVDSADVSGSQLGCVKSPRDEERRTGERCGPKQNGEIVELGFKEGTSFKTVLSLCHNGGTERTYYTRHTLRGAKLQFHSVDQMRPAFKEGKIFFKKISASSSYSQRNQKKVFTRILGGNRSSEVLESSYLARGHLAPDADFVFKEWEEVTYYYGNAAPQWQSINNGNWRRLENMIRSKAMRLNRDLEIYSGTLGILQVLGDTGLQEVWLATDGDKNYLPVPEYFFKIIVDHEAEESIGMFGTNDIFIQRILRSTSVCTDICEQTGWADQFEDRFKAEDGMVFCCSPEQISNILSWVGAGIENHNVLNY